MATHAAELVVKELENAFRAINRAKRIAATGIKKTTGERQATWEDTYETLVTIREDMEFTLGLQGDDPETESLIAMLRGIVKEDS